MTAATAPESRPPRQVAESLPSLNLDDCLSNIRSNVGFVQWEAENGAVLGSGAYLLLPDALDLDFRISSHYELGCRLPWIDTSNGVTAKRRRFMCNGCRKPCTVLYLIDAWKCRTCHKLLYASQKKNPLAKTASNYDQLMVTSRRPRRSGEHLNVYERRRQAAQAELKRLAQFPMVVRHNQPIVTKVVSRYSPGPPGE